MSRVCVRLWSNVLAVAFLTAASLLMPASHAAADAAQGSRNLHVQTITPATARTARVALVIGNAAYRDAPLANSVKDARAMATTLDRAGFKVLLQLDVDHRRMVGALRDFGTELRAADVGLFYYAGHGMQIKGRNYLIPIGADFERENEVAYSALDAQAVLDKMAVAGNGANVVILDACRNNPFVRSFRSSAQGLAPMEAPVGTLIAFATAPGAVASDGSDGNGLYTQHLLRAMSVPGVKVEDMFKQVRTAVRRESGGKQVPWETTSLEGDLYFLQQAGHEADPLVQSEKSPVEEAVWSVIERATDPAVIAAYLERFPNGVFASRAAALRARLEEAARLTDQSNAQQGSSAPAQSPTYPGTPHERPRLQVGAIPVSDQASAPSVGSQKERINGSNWTLDQVLARRLAAPRSEQVSR